MAKAWPGFLLSSNKGGKLSVVARHNILNGKRPTSLNSYRVLKDEYSTNMTETEQDSEAVTTLLLYQTNA